MASQTESRTALVTGGGKGVGAGVVKALAARGVRCCINCNTNPDMAQNTLRAVTEAGGEGFVFQADVSDPDQLEKMVKAVIRRWGRLDILVNNAALQPNLFIDQYDADTLKKIWNINIGGYFHAVRACLPYLRKSNCGRVVNISSIHGKRPTGFDAGYAMTKGAIRMFTRELALELYRDGITVNAIDLGGCKIEFKTGNAPITAFSPMDCRNPAETTFRLVTPGDVGEMVCYLCSPEASAVTGDGIRLDKGYVLT